MQGLSQEECFGGPNESLREPPGGGLGDFPVGPVWAFLGEAGAGCGGYGSGAGEGGVLTPERAHTHTHTHTLQTYPPHTPPHVPGDAGFREARNKRGGRNVLKK